MNVQNCCMSVGIKVKQTQLDDFLIFYKPFNYDADLSVMELTFLLFNTLLRSTKLYLDMQRCLHCNLEVHICQWRFAAEPSPSPPPSLFLWTELRLATRELQVCTIVEGQKYSKKLNDRQVTALLRATCQRPREREQSIRDVSIVYILLYVCLWFFVFFFAWSLGFSICFSSLYCFVLSSCR